MVGLSGADSKLAARRYSARSLTTAPIHPVYRLCPLARDWLQGEVLTAQLALLAAAVRWHFQLNLPDRRRLAVQTTGATQRLQLPKSLSEALEALSQREGVTLFMTLLAAFKPCCTATHSKRILQWVRITATVVRLKVNWFCQ